MAEFETDRRDVRITLEGRARPSLVSSTPDSNFVSQLLAAHVVLPPLRERRRANAEGAIGAYKAGARIAVRRMPAGYRTTIVA
jgi:hypothetical protein